MTHPTSHLICAPFPRLCITAVGADAGSYLHSQSSNDLTSLKSGASRYTFVLEPSGKIVALVRVTRTDEDSYLLDTDPVEDLADVLLARLNKFKIRVDVDFRVDRRDCVALRSLDGASIGESARNALGSSTASVAVDAYWSDGTALDVLSLRSEVSLDTSSVAAMVPGAVVSTADSLDVERVRVGWPRMGAEIVPGETIVAATGLAPIAVSFSKGCYPGQELVERMDSRGSSAPRMLRKFSRPEVPCADPALLTPGDSLFVDGTEIGIVTSVAGDRVLAYVARGVEAGESITPEG